MSITNGYISLEEFHAFVDQSGLVKWSAADVLVQEMAIEAASRWIDEYCGTRFYTYAGAAADETRYYNAYDYRCFFPDDDIASITSIKLDDDDDGTYEITLATTDYVLYPLNASNDNLPYRMIEMDDDSNYSFPVGVQKGIEIVGRFGYKDGLAVTAPEPVKNACFLLSHDLWKLRNRPVSGSNPVSGGFTSGSIAFAKAILNGISRRGGFY
jgi:hypothetical protein